MSNRLSGHLWTIGPSLWGRWRGNGTRGEPWRCTVADPRMGSVVLAGTLCAAPHHTTLCVIVHGLGGSATSGYMHRFAAACRRADIAALRLSMRGADRSGEDIYHAGLVDDLRCIVADPSLARFSRIILVGYSLGGHVALHLGLSSVRDGGRPSRVTAIATLCSPLDLQATARSFDTGPRWLYRKHVLDGLREMYAAIDRRGRGWVDPASLTSIDRIEEWDETVVVPRFGFRSATAYYQSMSIAPRLREIRIPTLILHGRNDPMVRWSTIEPWRKASEWVVFDELDGGGHCGFPRRTGFTWSRERQPNTATIEDRVVAWCRHASLGPHEP